MENSIPKHSCKYNFMLKTNRDWYTCYVSLKDGAGEGSEARVDGGEGGGYGECIRHMAHQEAQVLP